MTDKNRQGDNDIEALRALARFSEENPSPVLRVTDDGQLLYANEASKNVKGLLSGPDRRVLSTRFTARLLENIAAGVASFEYVSAARSFQFSLNVVTDEG